MKQIIKYSTECDPDCRHFDQRYDCNCSFRRKKENIKKGFRCVDDYEVIVPSGKDLCPHCYGRGFRYVGIPGNNVKYNLTKWERPLGVAAIAFLILFVILIIYRGIVYDDAAVKDYITQLQLEIIIKNELIADLERIEYGKRIISGAYMLMKPIPEGGFNWDFYEFLEKNKKKLVKSFKMIYNYRMGYSKNDKTKQSKQ